MNSSSDKNYLIRFEIKGALRIWFMLGLFQGSILNSCEIKVLRASEQFVGGGGYFPVTIYIASTCKDPPLKGGFNAHISYSNTPRDQESLLKLQGLFSMISGDK